ncbi:hypothetical protein CVT26_001217 [Gymnopilus dilepis]|uniref:Uncharacterized protein n=1 Tax=Gymnopilus dilepis TaxID=231916 RepID=A0A409YLR7_9AGAR|nr:hypothetical protein CVT26_001217 [Gymnopilus dilepis]
MSTAVRLPVIHRWANWHPVSGLITSPRSKLTPDTLSGNPFDHSRPRKLEDGDIYLAFVPRSRCAEGLAFACLDWPDAKLSQRIGRDEDLPGKWRLSWGISKDWNSLEKTLMTIATRLIWGHPLREIFPEINLPASPSSYDYLKVHDSRTEAFDAARRARDAFPFLIGLVSFAFALWLTEYEHDCMEAAIAHILEHDRHNLPPAFLDMLKSSVACDFSPGIRPGAFLIPYDTLWGPLLGRFTRANVPIWLLWGDKISSKTVERLGDRGMEFYLPPKEVIAAAKARAGLRDIPLPTPVVQSTISTQVLPPASSTAVVAVSPPADPSSPAEVWNEQAGYDSEDDMMDVDGGGGGADEAPPSEPPPVRQLSLAERNAIRANVIRGSGQKAGEDPLMVFMRHLKEQREYEKNETRLQKERRLNQARANRTWYTDTSSVYTWEQDLDDPTFWRRRLLEKRERYDEFKSAEPWQRWYWSYNNTWDLMFYEEKPPADYKPPTTWQNNGDSDDENGVEPYAFMNRVVPESVPTPTSSLQTLAATNIADDARASLQRACNRPTAQSIDYSIPFSNLANHLRIRYGFNVDDPIAFAATLGNVDAASRKAKFKAALRVLGYLSAHPGLVTMSVAAELSVASFAGTLGSASLADEYIGMKLAWDIWSDFVPVNQGIRVQMVSSALERTSSKPLYVLRPLRHSSTWLVATTSATVVLLVLRKNWPSSQDIASGLLEMGIRFHTVVERPKNAATERKARVAARANSSDEEKQDGLGVREHGYAPDQVDYTAYLASRRQLLLGPRGRALRLVGGIVGRIASETVTDQSVLQGPIFCDTIIGTSDTMEYVDDGVSLRDCNIVCGVYSVTRKDGIGKPAQRSWFPQRTLWENQCGLHDEQWLPDAETWYRTLVTKFQNGIYNVPKAREWKGAVRFQKVRSERLQRENEDWARAFIGVHLPLYRGC